MRLIIVHPGIQHSYRLANGALQSGLFEKVTLLTSILFKPQQKVFGKLKKRIKPIDKDVKIINHYIYTFFYSITKFIYNKLFVNPHNQSHNNPIYFWQQVFGYLCLPYIYLNRKNLVVVCFETTGWPVVKYCKKWNIPVMMDFASISHEKAKELGIHETNFGIKLKTRERNFIDYALYCSKFCKDSFNGLTSAKQEFVLYLGADPSTTCQPHRQALRIENSESGKMENSLNRQVKSLKNQMIKISFIANLEYRKGLDIFLEALYAYHYPVFLEVHLIGRIREDWVNQHLPNSIVNQNIKLIYQPAMSQPDLFSYLKKENFDLNVQSSRFDSFAMVVPETMIQGIPNIVSPYVGSGEMITHGKDGFVMEKLDSSSLNKILNYYLKLDIEEKLNLKNNVLKSSTHMTWGNYYQNIEQSLTLILKNI